MSRIAIDDLPALETLTAEQMAELFGRGLATTRLGVTTLEAREMMSVSQLVMTGTTLTVYTDNASTSVQFDHSNGGVAISEVGTGRWWVRQGVQTVQFIGGNGNDTVRHNMNIRINAWGGAGNDVLIGGTTSDQLVGGVGDDRLIGRAGTDALYGGWGDDTLISLDAGAVDYLHGGPGRDAFWTDKTGAQQDTVADLGTGDRLNAVTAFANAGADRTLNGDRIADPTAGTGLHVRFANNALFSAAGPQASDITQGAIGDCWLMAGLGAIATDSPTTLRQNVVDFGDGTYGVRLGNSFYRVDDDLRVRTGSRELIGAQLGAGNSMWVAIVEKAYTHYRTGANTYTSLSGGWGIEVNQAFGSTTAGRAGFTTDTAGSVLNQMWGRFNNFESLTVSFFSRSSSASGENPLVFNHMYTVSWIQRGADGQVESIQLRNPWGTDGTTVSDAHNDGFVTLTPAQFAQFSGQFNYGKV